MNANESPGSDDKQLPLPDKRDLLGALLRSSVETSSERDVDLVWRTLRFDAERLELELIELAGRYGRRDASTRKRLGRFAQQYSERFGVRIFRDDSITLPVLQERLNIPRELVGEVVSALDTNLFPSRRGAQRAAMESARELAYFGYGALPQQVMPHPLELILGAIRGDESVYVEPVLLNDEVEPLGRRWSIVELLAQDESFHRPLASENELARFQEHLRTDPLDGAAVVDMRDFFSRRTTIGWRDTTRWLMGGRHPWFGWNVARELIGSCFEKWGMENFLAPRRIILAVDPGISNDELVKRQEDNLEMARLVADRVREKLDADIARKIERDHWVPLAAAALDCRHDFTDFDLETVGEPMGRYTARFLSRLADTASRYLIGRSWRFPGNHNLAGHFLVKGVQQRWLSRLDAEERRRLYDVLAEVLNQVETQGQQAADSGSYPSYRRIPTRLCYFYELPGPCPRADETVLDSFRLSEMRNNPHAGFLRAHPEIFEKLVVFFTLTYRHYLDTRHVPDLRPIRLVRDFVFLGRWGTNTENLVVNLYQHQKTGKVRSEIRLFGSSQVRAHREAEERKPDAAVARLIVSQLVPLLQPSLLRALGNFVMAVEESRQGTRHQRMDAVAVASQALEVFRESARTGLKASLVDLATWLELLVDGSVDTAQQQLKRLDGLLSSDDERRK